jgi:Flp pilus assembly protein TadG
VQIAVTEAAAVGARAAVAGLDCTERTILAKTAVTNFFDDYGGFLHDAITPDPKCDAAGAGTFQVTVSYDIGSLGLRLMGGFVPVPTTNPTATVTVSTGGL